MYRVLNLTPNDTASKLNELSETYEIEVVAQSSVPGEHKSVIYDERAIVITTIILTSKEN